MAVHSVSSSPPRPLALITGGLGDLAQALRGALEASGLAVLAPGRGELDVTDTAAVRAYFAEKVPSLDLLINNAGLCQDMSMARMGEAEFDTVVDVNLKGAFLVSQAAVKLMARQRQGHVVNIGSYSALSGPFGQANYAAAKAGLVGLTQSVAREYGARNVRVNCVLPGFLDTKMTRHLLEDEAWKARLLEGHTLGRLNSPQDAARFVAFLHTHMPNVSGQVFQLDSRIRRMV